jgi:hypothetical protein
MAKQERAWSPPQMFWSALIAIVVWSAVGFSWFGTGFDWTTQLGASRISDKALVENLASICVAQANGASDSEAELKKLKALDEWKRRDFIESAKWATMPGSTLPRSGVADLCVEKLLAT